MDQNIHITSLIKQYADGSISHADLLLLEQWLKDNPDENITPSLRDWFFETQPIHKLDANTREAIHREVLMHIGRKAKILKLRSLVIKSAAAVVLFFTLGAVIINKFRNSKLNQGTSKEIAVDILPGVKGGVFETETGEQIVLNPEDNGKEISSLLANKSRNPGIENARLITKKGQEMNFTLPDGTRVWLNAGSILTLSKEFNKDTRTVALNGEAYFEVQHDASKPFLVNLPGMLGETSRIMVLGTRFNVSAYAKDTAIKATLVEGIINMSNGSHSIVLKPGQEASIDNKQARGLFLADADTAIATSWKEGFFKFDNAPIEEILTKIGRWYNVDIVYKDLVPASNYSGTISKSLKLSALLEALQSSGLGFKVSGRQLIVSKAST